MDPKRLEEIITCGVCFEFFNEGNRCPRILSCGHTFCHSCLEKLLVQSLTCPTCKGQIPLHAAELIPVNFIAKNMISFAKQEETGSNKVQSDLPESSCSSTNSGKLEYEGYCSEHCNHKELRCMDCKLWICAMCAFLSHKECRTLLAKEAFKELKGQFALKVEKELKVLEKSKSEILEFIQINEEEKEEIIVEIRMKENELNEIKKRIENFHLLKSENCELCENLRLLQIAAENSTDDNEFSKAKRELEELFAQGKKLVSQCKSFDVYSSFPSTVEDLRKLCEVKSVFVVRKENEKFYGKIAVRDGQVWISSFKLKKPSTVLFPIKILLQEITASTALPKKVFFKLTPADESSSEEVDLIIETVGDSGRVRNFILLCSALKGESYKGRNLILHEDIFGNSRYSMNLFPAYAVEGIDADKQKSKWTVGIVQGNLNDSGFSITRNRGLPGYSVYMIGNIVCGIQKLIKIRANSLIIKDCGLVI